MLIVIKNTRLVARVFCGVSTLPFIYFDAFLLQHLAILTPHYFNADL